MPRQADSGEHPVELFSQRLASLGSYPPGVVPVPEYLRGTAFFSAANGLVINDPDGPLPPFPFGGVMFVGHNLDSETAFLSRLASGLPHGGPHRPMLTWRNLYRLLDAAGIAAESCFFTNAYVGLKAGDDPTGPSPGRPTTTSVPGAGTSWASDPRWWRPAVVAALGTDARQFLATMAPELAA